MIHLLAALGAVTFLVILLLTDAGEIRRRARQAGHLLAEAGPWLAAALARKLRGEFASPSPVAMAERKCACDACAAELNPVAFADWEREFHGRRTS